MTSSTEVNLSSYTVSPGPTGLAQQASSRFVPGSVIFNVYVLLTRSHLSDALSRAELLRSDLGGQESEAYH